VIWGSGRARREFLYVDDMVEGCIDVMALTRAGYDSRPTPMRGHINLGTGEDVSIAELAQLIGDVVGYAAGIRYDLSQPDGAPESCSTCRAPPPSGGAPRCGWKKACAAPTRTTRRRFARSKRSRTPEPNAHTLTHEALS
jgi:nucleoside-diphosphate-sugar epimerase